MAMFSIAPAIDRFVAWQLALGRDEVLINPIKTFGCPDRKAFQPLGLRIPDALAKDLPGLGATIGELVNAEPSQGQAAQPIGIFERPEKDAHLLALQINVRLAASPDLVSHPQLFQNPHHGGDRDIVQMRIGGTTNQALAAWIAAGGPQRLMAERVGFAAPNRT
jgi:hypothetical protein